MNNITLPHLSILMLVITLTIITTFVVSCGIYAVYFKYVLRISNHKNHMWLYATTLTLPLSFIVTVAALLI